MVSTVKAEREGDAEEADAELRFADHAVVGDEELGGEDGATAAAEDQPEGAEQLREPLGSDRIGVHRFS